MHNNSFLNRFFCFSLKVKADFTCASYLLLHSLSLLFSLSPYFLSLSLSLSFSLPYLCDSRDPNGMSLNLRHFFTFFLPWLHHIYLRSWKSVLIDWNAKFVHFKAFMKNHKTHTVVNLKWSNTMTALICYFDLAAFSLRRGKHQDNSSLNEMGEKETSSFTFYFFIF